MSPNLTELKLNKSYVSISLTPELFLKIYESIYKKDKDIILARKWASILNILLMFIGINGNILNIIAFSNKKMRKHKFNIYFLVSTLFKLIFCLTLLFDYLFSKIYSESIFLHSLHTASEIIIDFIIHISDSFVSILTLFLSLDRLYAILYPLKIKEFITNLYAKSLTIISLLILIVVKITSVILCSIIIDTNIILIICVIITPSVLNIIPLCIIFIINILLVTKLINYNFKDSKSVEFLGRASISFFKFKLDDEKLRDSNRNESLELTELTLPLRKKSVNLLVESNEMKRLDSNTSARTSRIVSRNVSCVSKNLSLQKKSHYVVIIISDVCSILTTIPYYFFNFYFFLFKLNCFNIETLIFIQITSSLLFNSNHCLNFIVYLIFYDDFRGVLKNLFLKFKCKNSSSTPVTL
jgi:hypothetical protein